MSQWDNIIIEELCRACFKPRNEYKMLFEESDDTNKLTLGEIFSQVAKIEVKSGTIISPNRICLDCIKELNIAFNFIQKSQQNNDQFLEYLKSSYSKQPDCLSELPIDIPTDTNAVEFPQIKVENELLNDYGDAFSDELVSLLTASDGSDSTINNCDEPPLHKEKKTNKMQCTYCDRIFKRLDFLENHKKKHEEEMNKEEEVADDSVALLCDECGFSCTSKEELKVHLEKQHKDSSGTDDKIKTRGQQNKMNTRSQSKKLTTTAGRFECDSCSKTFAWKKDLYRHERYHQPNTKKFPCPYCERRFIRKDKLSSHLQVHIDGMDKAHTLKSFQHFANQLYLDKKFKQIKCMICNFDEFSNVRELRQHISLHNNLESVEDLANSHVVERFYPGMDLKDILPLLNKEIRQKQFGKLCSIVNAQSYEMGISDSDESDPEAKVFYSCEVCMEQFSRKHKLMTHQAYEHSFEACPYECEKCKLKFINKDVFLSHRKHHCENPDRKFQCPRCPGRFTWSQNMENHKCRKKNSVNKEKNKCEICEKAFTCPRDLRLHKMDHIPEGKTHDCSICEEKFARYESLRFHLKLHSKNQKLFTLKKMSCMLCNTELPSINSLKTHLFLHSDGKTEVDLKNCEFANVFYPDADESQISEVIKKCFEDRNFGQLYIAINKFGLEMTLSDSDSDDDLQLNKTSVKTFVCALCDLKFPRMQSILEHQHTEHDAFLQTDFPYKCDKCDDQFVCKDLLQRHSILGCLSLDRIACNKCGCKFVWKQNLNAHNCLTNEKNPEDVNQCEVCGKKFNWLKDLYRHSRTHIPEERKFECLVCERKFNRKDNMRAHMKVHNVDLKLRTKAMYKWDQLDDNLCRPNGEKIIQCKICLTIHNSIRDLITHLMTHKDRSTLKQKESEVKEISIILYHKQMDLDSLSKAIYEDLTNGKYIRFYSITNEVGYELSLTDSETATDLDADDDEDDSDPRKEYTCMLCGKKFNRKFKIFNHQRQEHPWDELPLECEHCSAKFVCEKTYDMHMKKECDNVEKRNKCKMCPLKFIWKENLKNHEKYMHDKNPIYPKKHHCDICSRSFIWLKDLLRHKKSHKLEEQKFECTWCFRVFMRRDNLKVHMKVHQNATHLLLPDIYYLARPNSTKVAECKLCNEKYTTANELLQHLRSVHLLPETAPDPASYSITNALGYEMDIEDSETEREEPNEKYSCELCETRFNRRFKLLQHQQSLHYSDNIPHKCDHCNFKCVSETVLAYHMRTQCMNDVKQFRCSKCTMRFMWRENLENHESVIHSSRTFSCDICKRDFATQHDLKNHGDCKPPLEVKLFECDMCDRKYNRKDRLMTHVKIHNEKYKEQRMKSSASTDKKYLCAFCGKEVSSSSNLVIHMRRHTGEKPFKCEFCNKGFPRSSDLSCHRRTHTGEKPHKCTVCEKAFSRSYKLQTHMRIHSGERPYKCTYCEKSFTQSNDLTLHVRRHTGERPYTCETCGERFIQGTALRNHRRMRGHYDV